MTSASETFPEPERRRTVSGSDLRILLSLPAGLFLAWALPEACWAALGRSAAHVRRSKVVGLAEHMQRITGPASLSIPLENAASEYIANRLQAKLQRLRLLTPRGWHPQLRLEGGQHIQAALARGHGAVLWIAPFLFGGLVSKLTLHQAGFPASHLSRHDHGFSRTAFGIRVLNPVITRIEGRYTERIVIPPDGSVRGAVLAMHRKLQENGLVSVTVGPQGVLAIPAPLFAGSMMVATGAPNLAARAGAPLLPVVVIAESPASFTTIVEPPIELSPGLAPAATALQAIRELGRRLEPYVVRWPGQFIWAELRPGGAQELPVETQV